MALSIPRRRSPTSPWSGVSRTSSSSGTRVAAAELLGALLPHVARRRSPSPSARVSSRSCVSVTVPATRTNANGGRSSSTHSATRGSRRIDRPFRVVSPVVKITSSPSSTNQTGRHGGRPVLAHDRQLRRARPLEQERADLLRGHRSGHRAQHPRPCGVLTSNATTTDPAARGGRGRAGAAPLAPDRRHTPAPASSPSSRRRARCSASTTRCARRPSTRSSRLRRDAHARARAAGTRVLRKPNARTKPSDLDREGPELGRATTSPSYDAIFTQAAERGIEVIPTITGAASRAGRPAGKRGNNYKPDRNAFERFVEAVGTRYGDRVDTWTIWNEPNQPQFLNPQFVQGQAVLAAALPRALPGGAAGPRRDRQRRRHGPRRRDLARAATANIVAPITFARIFFKGTQARGRRLGAPPVHEEGRARSTSRKKVDVTIGVLSRLTKALDRYSQAPPAARLPDRVRHPVQAGPLLRRQRAAGRPSTASIAEKIAYDNSRVARVPPVPDARRPAAQGLRQATAASSPACGYADGRKKLAYDGFRLPLVADASGSAGRAVGPRAAGGRARRPSRVEYRDKAAAWKRVAERRDEQPRRAGPSARARTQGPRVPRALGDASPGPDDARATVARA